MAEGVIEIIIGGTAEMGGSGGGSNSKKKSQEDIYLDKVKKMAHPISSLKGLMGEAVESVLGKTSAAGASYFVGKAVSTAYRIAKMELNRSFSLKENYLGQNKLTALESEMGAVREMATSVGAGAVSGAMFGYKFGLAGIAIGAVGGSIFGAVTGAMDVLIQKEETMERHNMQLNSTNAQTTFSASRAALVNGSRGTEY